MGEKKNGPSPKTDEGAANLLIYKMFWRGSAEKRGAYLLPICYLLRGIVPAQTTGGRCNVDNYIIRIYRCEKDNPRKFVGMVETVGKNEKRAFTNYDELWEILNATGNLLKGRKGIGEWEKR